MKFVPLYSLIHCIFRILFAVAWHAEWPLLQRDVIGDWMIPFAAMLQWLAQQRLPMLLICPDNPLKLSLPVGNLQPHILHGSLVPCSQQLIQNSPSISSAIFAHRTVEYLIILQWFATFPKNSPFPLGDRVPYLTHGT